MRARELAVVVGAVCVVGVGALPASAHHTEQHNRYTTESCSPVPPPQSSGVVFVSGWSVHAGSPTGVQWSDGYVFADGSPSGVSVYTFVPYWDDRGPTQGPHWVDARITVGPGGVETCNRSRLPG